LTRGIGLKGISRAAEETAIGIAVAEAGGNLQQAAQRLGVTDRTLQLRRAARRQDT
jgi:transcriptional regulator with PAS, ATPase and Fis domain